MVVWCSPEGSTLPPLTMQVTRAASSSIFSDCQSLKVAFEKSISLTPFTEPDLSYTPPGSTSIESDASRDAKAPKLQFLRASQIIFSLAIGLSNRKEQSAIKQRYEQSLLIITV